MRGRTKPEREARLRERNVIFTVKHDLQARNHSKAVLLWEIPSHRAPNIPHPSESGRPLMGFFPSALVFGS